MSGRAKDKLLETIAVLMIELDRHPTQVEVAARLGVSKQRVGQLFNETGLDPRTGVNARNAERRLATTAKAEAESIGRGRRRANRESRNIEIRRLAADGKTQLVISELVGVVQSCVSKVLRATPGASFRSRRMFTADEDALVMSSMTIAEVANFTGRAYQTVRDRRALIRSRDLNS